MVWNWFHTYCLTHEFSVLPCSSMFYDMSSHPSLNHIHQAEGPGEVKNPDPWCPEKKTNDRLLEFSSQPYLYLSHTHTYIYIYIYLLLGEAWGSPEHRGTFNLAIQLYMSDLLLIYRRVGRCGINVLWTGLEPRCCYVEDVEDVARLKYVYVEDVEHVARLKTLKMLKMLLGWSVFTLKMLNMLLCWRRCYVEDAATLKMFSRWRCWRCCYVEMLLCVHFAHASLGNYDIFMGSMRTLKFYQHAILLVSTETT